MTFEEFCEKNCDGLYDPKLSPNDQCNGYHQLRKMFDENITPASIDELIRWEQSPTREEMQSTPDIKYLQFLHPLLRPHIINHWYYIKTLKRW